MTTSTVVLLAGILTMQPSLQADPTPGPRSTTWQQIEKALDEGMPKTASDLLAGIEQAATAERRWDEAARALATRVLANNADRPGDDPQRLIDLASAAATAPAESHGVLAAIQANWTWSFFLQNRWRFAQRTTQAADVTAGRDLATIASWDLRQIVAEIRERFALALAAEAKLQQCSVGEWAMLIEAGTMPPTYRPTVWDVVVHDAIAFAASGERGLIEPEDAFELTASSPALEPVAEFRSWKADQGGTAGRPVTDVDSPLLQAVRLYQSLLAFHAADNDQTAFLAADLERLVWAGSTAVADGDAEPQPRLRIALEKFIQRAGGHELTAQARLQLATSLRQDEPAEAHAVASRAVADHPRSVGGRLCQNLLREIEARELSLVSERVWAAPWPVIDVSYRNLTRVHLRLVRADWQARLEAGKPTGHWLDDADRKAILAQPSVQTFVADLPATTDYRTATHAIPVEQAFAAANLAPGGYWVLASHREDFGEQDNVVAAAFAWVSRLALVTTTDHRSPDGRCSGCVVDIASGEPVAGATVTNWTREQRRGQRFVPHATAISDADGSFSVAGEEGRESVLVARVTHEGHEQVISTDTMHFWRHHDQAEVQRSIVLMTDRGIYRPGQTVQCKGILYEVGPEGRGARAIEQTAVETILRDANGRDVAKVSAATNPFGSFTATFSLPLGTLPGQWSLAARSGNASAAVGIRVEEYKRPKFQVELAAPTDSVRLDADVSLAGKATTYTGLAVAGGRVVWRVEREIRWPIWCRWFFPALPFDAGSRRIARGSATTDENGSFTISFPAVADRGVPRESLPVFTYKVTADVTDAGGETRSADRRVAAGYADVEARISADEWQAASAAQATEVPLEITTTSLDGQPRAAGGRLVLTRVVQPAAVHRGSVGGMVPRPLTRQPRRGRAFSMPMAEPDSSSPETWLDGETIVDQPVVTEITTGRAVATVELAAGLYRATFTIPAADDQPTVKATQLVEVIDPAAPRYPVKRAFILRPAKNSVPVGSALVAVVGTGYDEGRILVEIVKAGRVLDRFWTERGSTQTGIQKLVGEEHRGGITLRAWMVREGRLHAESRTIDIPWTNKSLEVTWERFTRRVEPAAQEIWRARIRSGADPLAGPAAPAVAEMVATLYDQSLDALASHAWPKSLGSLFPGEWSGLQIGFTNMATQFLQIRGHWDLRLEGVPITFSRFREPFGSPLGETGFFGGGMARRGRMMAGFPMAMAAAPAAEAMLADAVGANGMLRKSADRAELQAGKQQDKQAADEGEGSAGQPAAATAPPPRRNLAETAFFLPSLVSDEAGLVTIEFVLPDTLTTWQFKALAHDADLRSGSLVDSCVAAKDLMVEPMPPRFLREGDVLDLPVKVSNRSTGRLTGSVRLALADARTGDARDRLIDGPKELPFDLPAGGSEPFVFRLRVADGTDILRYLASGTATGSARPVADGEEALLPVLPRKVLVTETVPVTLVGGGDRRQVVLEKLAALGDAKGDQPSTIESQSLVVQVVSNPAWQAVMSLPYLLEEADEGVDTLFQRLYANVYAHHVVASDPRIEQVFAQWRSGAARDAPLERNTDLVKTLLAETPWVREATDEREARGRAALLFEKNRVQTELAAAAARLTMLRNPDGGWPWFPGGRSCDSVTLAIAAGFGRLRANGVAIDMAPALAAIPWIDGRLIEERERALRLWKQESDRVVLTPVGVFALYARSFFTADAPPQAAAADAISWGLGVGRQSWMRLDARRSQGQLAIALARGGDQETARSILGSLRQRAVGGPVGQQTGGRGEDNWQGMWWRDPHPGWWNWVAAPIETQSLLIEAFDEVEGDAASVEAMKAWLIAQKRTSRWPGSGATADAIGALLGRGQGLLGDTSLVAVSIGGRQVGGEAAGRTQMEAGTGFFEARFSRQEIEPRLATIEFAKPAAGTGLSFAGVHWQYLDAIDGVTAQGRDELAVSKQLFVKRQTKAGPVLEPLHTEDDEGSRQAGSATVGDELVVRLTVTSDRDYEFLEMTDHRPSLTEPVDVLSGWRWSDGVGWYQVTRDASTQFFFERLPRGTHVFEYALRVAHRGAASSGFATIRSRYAPEFSARSASIPVAVREQGD